MAVTALIVAQEKATATLLTDPYVIKAVKGAVCQSLDPETAEPSWLRKTTGFIFKTEFKRVLPVKTKTKNYLTLNCFGWI